MHGAAQLGADEAEVRKGAVRSVSHVTYLLVIFLFSLWHHVVSLTWWVQVLTIVVRCGEAIYIAYAGIGNRRHG